MDFIGIDLAWKKPPNDSGTALCILDSSGRITEVQLLTKDHEILGEMERFECAWVGIDAPLIVNNEGGIRRCERALFDRGIRVLPASQGYFTRKFGGCRGVELAQSLSIMGHAFPGTGHCSKVMMEVYPYGALHVVTGGHIPRYKRGNSEERRTAALELLGILRDWLPVSIPDWLDEEVVSASPSGLKRVMDKIDAVISVLCVYGHWIYSGKRTEVLGDADDGFILLPRQVIDNDSR